MARCSPAEVAREMVVYIRRDGAHDQASVFLDFRTHIHPAVHRVQDWIVRNPSAKGSIEQLAEVAAMSPRNLTRVFRKETGISIKEYATRVRVERRPRLLLRRQSFVSLTMTPERTPST